MNEGSAFSMLWELARTAGPFATVFATFIWWLERSERVRIQKEKDAMSERVVVGLFQASEAVKESTDLLKQSLYRGQG